MNVRTRNRCIGGGSILFVALAVACGGGDDSNNSGTDGGGGDATTGKDGGIGSDGSSRDSGNGDGGIDAGPVCTSSPCVTQISAGGDNTCALLSDKTVRCWGNNAFGQLGVGFTDAGFDAAPYSIPNAVPGLTAIDEIATGDYQDYNAWNCVRSGTTGIRCWGDDSYGELGKGDASLDTSNPQTTPTAVVGLTAAKQLSLYGGESCALDPSGKIACWGNNNQLGLGRPTDFDHEPYAAFMEGGTSNYTHVAAGEAQTCAIDALGEVQCWGWNFHETLGRPDADTLQNDVTPQVVPGVTGVTQLVAGLDFYCALETSGVLCWGQNDAGQLGRGAATSDSPVAMPVTVLPAGHTVKLIGASQQSVCAVLDDDSLWCWGMNKLGEIGLDPGADAGIDAGAFPANRVPGISGKVIQIAGGFRHMCALLENGSVSCWGSNSFGQLGRGATDGGGPDGVPHPDPKPVAF